MKETKNTVYEVAITDKFYCKVYERDDLEGAIKVYNAYKDNPLVKEIVIQRVERTVVTRLFNGKESNY